MEPILKYMDVTGTVVDEQQLYDSISLKKIRTHHLKYVPKGYATMISLVDGNYLVYAEKIEG